MSPRRAACLAVLLLLLPSCMKLGEEKKKDKDSETKEIPLVRIAALKRRTLDRTLEITGAVEAMKYVSVIPKLEDTEVIELSVDVGDRVEAGAVLAKLDATDARMIEDDTKVAQAEATVQLKDSEIALRELEAQARAQKLSLDQGQKSLDRGKAQAEKGAISQEALDALQYRRDQEASMAERLAIQIEKAQVMVELARKSQEKAALALAKAQRRVGYATLKAPISGIVAKRSAMIGQQTFVTSLTKGALFEIFDPRSLVINSQITQRDLPYVKIGLPVEIRSDACPGATFTGTVAVISPIIDAAAGTVPIRIEIKESEGLKPGLFVSGRIVLEAKPNTLVVPKKAVLYERERPYVMKVVQDAAQPRVARVFFREGLSGKEEVEAITEPGAIADADRIVLVGHDRLRDGDQVKIENGPDGAESKPGAGANGGG